MEWVVTTGRTIEEALETALDQLGVDEQDVEHEVLQEPQRGLFGRLRAEAQVRARVRPSPPPPKVDRRDRRRRDRRGRDGDRTRSRDRAKAGRSGGAGGGGGRSAGSAPGAGSGSGSGSGSAKGGQGVQVEARVGAGSNGSGEPVGPGPDRPGEGSGQGGGQDGGQRRRRRRRSRSGGSGKAQGADVVTDSTTTTDVDTTLDIEAQRAAVEEFLRGLLDAFGRSDATVTVTVVDGDTLEAAVDGSELGLLVGQKGTTLQSLQELVRSMVQRRFVGQAHARVRVDVAGYRERRRVALERFTLDVAASVRESGVAKALDPMGPADRKVVHDAVNQIEGVETVSEGQDDDRHVVIRPTA